MFLRAAAAAELGGRVLSLGSEESSLTPCHRLLRHLHVVLHVSDVLNSE